MTQKSFNELFTTAFANNALQLISEFYRSSTTLSINYYIVIVARLVLI